MNLGYSIISKILSLLTNGCDSLTWVFFNFFPQFSMYKAYTSVTKFDLFFISLILLQMEFSKFKIVTRQIPRWWLEGGNRKHAS
jgi:hypothetical protein